MWKKSLLFLFLFSSESFSNENFIKGNIELKNQNVETALGYFKKACEENELNGCYNAGTLDLKRGNADDAAEYFKASCEGGDPVACGDVGNIENNKGNQGVAKEYFQKSCEGKQYLSCHNLGILTLKGGDRKSALEYFELACNSEIVQACNEIGLIEALNENLPKSEPYFRKACDGDVLQGCLNLAILKLQSELHDEARPLLQKVCNENETRGCLVLAEFEKKQGNLNKSNEILETLCSKNVESACKELKKNKRMSVPKFLFNFGIITGLFILLWSLVFSKLVLWIVSFLRVKKISWVTLSILKILGAYVSTSLASLLTLQAIDGRAFGIKKMLFPFFGVLSIFIVIVFQFFPLIKIDDYEDKDYLLNYFITVGSILLFILSMFTEVFLISSVKYLYRGFEGIINLTFLDWLFEFSFAWYFWLGPFVAIFFMAIYAVSIRLEKR